MLYIEYIKLLNDEEKTACDIEDKNNWVSLDDFEKQMIKMVNDFYDKNGV